ncbi:MAG: DUF1730 domain-containing protein [Bacteriovorax sp.]|nr:DUF1730 domain-containing protein [Bacteriovorax sp.]
MFTQEQLTKWGVVDFGITSETTPSSLEHYNNWVEAKKHLPLTYLEGDRQEKRQDLKNYWPATSCALVFLFSYHQNHLSLKEIYDHHPDWNGLKLASYTLGFEGMDYHHLLKAHLLEIGEILKSKNPGLEFQLALDTHPVLDRDLAYRAGLGWFGKNSMLISKKHGSFFLIGSLLLNQKLPIAEMSTDLDHCGQCTRCIDACPTDAIDLETRTIIAKDCISTFTIEQFKLETPPSEKMTLMEGTLFGCDICQDICPWNKRLDRKLGESKNTDFFPEQKKILDFFLLRSKKDVHDELESMGQGEFKRYFRHTSFFRSGKRGLLKNIRLYLKEMTAK